MQALLKYRCILTLVVLTSLQSCIGCTQQTPQERLADFQGTARQQQELIEELTRLGAECLCAHFDKAPYVCIRLGRKWGGTNKTITLLRNLIRVDELTLEGSRIDDGLLKQVVSLPQLKVVRIRDTSITPRGLTELYRVQDLQGLELRQTALPPSVWRDLCALNPMWLHVERDAPPFGDDQPRPRQFGRLFSLCLSGARINDSTLRRVGRCRELRALELLDTSVTDAGLNSLATLTHLTHLDFTGTKIHGAGLRAIGNLPRLRELVLRNTAITDRVFSPILDMRVLESLTLDNTAVTDHGVARLAHQSALRTVSLIRTGTTLACLEPLSHNKTLITVIDNDGNVTLFQPAWLASYSGMWLPAWTKSRSKNLFLWKSTRRQLYCGESPD